MPPSYFSRLSVAFQRGTLVVEREGGPQQSVKALIGQGKLLFGNSRLLHAGSSKFGKLHVSSQHEIDAAKKFNLHLVNQTRNLSVIGVPTRTFSTIDVSGTSFQVCGCHFETSIFPLGIVSQKMPMAVSGMRAVVGDYTLSKLTSRHGHLTFSTNNAAICHGNRAYDGCRKVNMNLRSKERPNNYFLYGYFTLDVNRRTNNFVPNMGFRSMGLHSSTSACVSAGTAPDESFGNSALDEKHTSSVVSSKQKITAERTLKLLSGSCYLPHPDKEETGGEDAHFICDEQAIGVADGVGGWADLGINAGLYARELMSNSVTAIQEELKGLIDPARVLEKAHLRTKAKGSSTACIVALTNESLHAINLGDSGFVVVRDGCTIFRSPVQQHDFNFTYQLESGNGGDLPSSGQVFTIPVAPGDVMIAGTDGLFDNLYNNEVTAVVVHAMRAGLGPQVTAQKIAALAREQAQDKNRQTPFSSAAQDAGFRYYGGKLDDITVVVSYITSVTDGKSSSSQGSC